VQGGESWPQQSVYGGPNSLGLSGINWTPSALSYSGNYRADPVYGGGGTRQNQKLKWTYAGGSNQGVAFITQAAAGSGMTPGTYALSFGSGAAAGTITVTASAITNVTITNPGIYTTGVAPTVTAATGGTPVTLVAVLETLVGQEVAAGTNLSGETVRLLELGG
jgi:hypothetical protein